MEKRINIVAPSVEEALNKAVSELHIQSEKIFINVLGETNEGLSCEALVDINLTLEGKRYLEGILKNLNLTYQIESRSVNNESEIYYIIESNENPLIIGAHGRVLDAFQLLLRQVVSIYASERPILTLDIGSYRSSRVSSLEIIATKIAKEVVKTKRPVKLRPMNSFERRVIHEKLSEWRDVFTESEGTGTNRAIVVKPVKYKN